MAKMKPCPSCKAQMFKWYETCPDCGFDFPPIEKPTLLRNLLLGVGGVFLAMVALGSVLPDIEADTNATHESASGEVIDPYALGKERKAKMESISRATVEDYKGYSSRKRRRVMNSMIGVFGPLDADVKDKFYVCLSSYAYTRLDSLAMAELMQWCHNDMTKNPANFDAHYDELGAEDFTFDVSWICKARGKEMLLSPRSAKFSREGSYRIAGGQTYVFTANVDSKNTFGTEIRKQMFCTITFQNEDPERWVINNLYFE